MNINSATFATHWFPISSVMAALITVGSLRSQLESQQDQINRLAAVAPEALRQQITDIDLRLERIERNTDGAGNPHSDFGH